MNVLVYDNEEQIGIAAGNYMCGQVLAKPDSVLGLATGSTPLKHRLYQLPNLLFHTNARRQKFDEIHRLLHRKR